MTTTANTKTETTANDTTANETNNIFSKPVKSSKSTVCSLKCSFDGQTFDLFFNKTKTDIVDLSTISQETQDQLNLSVGDWQSKDYLLRQDVINSCQISKRWCLSVSLTGYNVNFYIDNGTTNYKVPSSKMPKFGFFGDAKQISVTSKDFGEWLEIIKNLKFSNKLDFASFK